MYALTFLFKKDLRNLLLIYSDDSAPMKKFFPSIGFKELFFINFLETLKWSEISLQI